MWPLLPNKTKLVAPLLFYCNLLCLFELYQNTLRLSVLTMIMSLSWPILTFSYVSFWNLFTLSCFSCQGLRNRPIDNAVMYRFDKKKVYLPCLSISEKLHIALSSLHRRQTVTWVHPCGQQKNTGCYDDIEEMHWESNEKCERLVFLLIRYEHKTKEQNMPVYSTHQVTKLWTTESWHFLPVSS